MSAGPRVRRRNNGCKRTKSRIFRHRRHGFTVGPEAARKHCEAAIADVQREEKEDRVATGTNVGVDPKMQDLVEKLIESGNENVAEYEKELAARKEDETRKRRIEEIAAAQIKGGMEFMDAKVKKSKGPRKSRAQKPAPAPARGGGGGSVEAAFAVDDSASDIEDLSDDNPKRAWMAAALAENPFDPTKKKGSGRGSGGGGVVSDFKKIVEKDAELEARRIAVEEKKLDQAAVQSFRDKHLADKAAELEKSKLEAEKEKIETDRMRAETERLKAITDQKKAEADAEERAASNKAQADMMMRMMNFMEKTLADRK